MDYVRMQGNGDPVRCEKEQRNGSKFKNANRKKILGLSVLFQKILCEFDID